MELPTLLLANLALVGGLMLAVWLLSLPLADVSIVDIAWGLSFVAVAAHSVWRCGAAPRGMLLLALASIWGLRLSAYLAWRNLGTGEDYRYRALRARFGASFPLVSLVVVFGLQAALVWVISLPLQVGGLGTAPLGWLDAAGLLVWAVGLGFEAVGDWQLARFKADPAHCRGVCRHGLWRYTRHPNYFGDFLVWWGIYLVAMAGGGWWTAIGPAVLTFLLLRVSGVALLERYERERKPDYADYIQTTNAFFPGPPRQPHSAGPR